MRLVIRKGTPKCQARHVTSSPRPIEPDVTPPIARSRERAIEAAWRSMSSERAKASSTGIASGVRHSNSTVT